MVTELKQKLQDETETAGRRLKHGRYFDRALGRVLEGYDVLKEAVDVEVVRRKLEAAEEQIEMTLDEFLEAVVVGSDKRSVYR